MHDYIKEVLETWDKLTSKRGKRQTAAPANLFEVREDCPKLDGKKKEGFHSVVAKMLFASKRARPDTGTSVAYLTTKVREPDQDDWMKLGHLKAYLRETEELPLILGADGSGFIKWLIDTS